MLYVFVRQHLKETVELELYLAFALHRLTLIRFHI